MDKQKALVFFGAHPDDESFGPGSTLARYAARGIRVYYVCSTGGEAGTVSSQYLSEYDTIAQLRSAELKCAAEALGLAGLINLGYRDSGMPGTEENKHPDSMAMAPLDQVVERMVRVIRDTRPEVVITHDPSTDYAHPDHIATHKSALKAFHAAGDPAQYPGSGTPFQPLKLYFGVRPHKTMRLIVKLMPLFGQDPHHFGRNGDIDFTRMVRTEYPVHAVIRLSKRDVDARRRAAACHGSQGGGAPRRGPFMILRLVEKVMGPRDFFMRVYPPPGKGRREKDLFEGVPG